MLAVSLKPDLFEGLRIEFSKPLNQNFALTHRYVPLSQSCLLSHTCIMLKVAVTLKSLSSDPFCDIHTKNLQNLEPFQRQPANEAEGVNQTPVCKTKVMIDYWQR